MTKDSSRFFEGSGELLLADGTVAAEGHGRYLKAPLEKMADFDTDLLESKIARLRKTRMKLICNYFNLIHRTEDQKNHKLHLHRLLP